ncbi:MAG: hypothetical protein N2170_00540 [Bacteroidia bacterium]|nr:hypothetical protein [Bacteroidia bacterium]
MLHRTLSQGTWRSKQAKMTAALYDRIYLFTDEPLPLPKGPFRLFDDLGKDVELW